MDINMDSVLKQKNMIINLLVLALAVGLAFNIYKRELSKESALRLEKEEQGKKNEVLVKISELEKKYGAYKKFINTKDASSIINTLNNIAKAEGVKINSIKPQALKEDGDHLYYSFVLTLSVKDYHVLGKFISRIESSSDVYSVEGIGISQRYEARGIAAQGQEEMVVDLGISTFLLK